LADDKETVMFDPEKKTKPKGPMNLPQGLIHSKWKSDCLFDKLFPSEKPAEKKGA
jgi:hypothetical protein